MNTIRTLMSVFLGAIIAFGLLGWRWAAALPEAKMDGARFVLALVMLSALAALGVIWSGKPRTAA